MEPLFSVEPISEKKGRGAVAKKFIPSGTIIDVSHVLVLSEADYLLIQDTLVYGYIFDWEKCDGQAQYALAMSSAEFINHSYKTNAEFIQDYATRTITFTALQDIMPGEEITMNYNGPMEPSDPVWFEVEE